MGGACSAYGGWEKRVENFGGKPEGKRPMGISRRKWEDNIKINLQELGCGVYGLDRAGSGQGQVAGTCECSNELFF